ncbi:MAG: DUF2794 domain-containing protein [Hyphomicrobiales bacterium]|jgi:hypothetical protein
MTDTTDPSLPVELDAHRQARSPTRRDDKRTKAVQAASDDIVRIVTSNNAPPSASQPAQITFNRRELDMILNVYGRMVAEGEWRDYAIDLLKDRAVFSVFRRAAEVPLYTIEKDPKMARRQGAYKVVAASGQILKRGHDLKQVLKVFDKKPKLELV